MRKFSTMNNLQYTVHMHTNFMDQETRHAPGLINNILGESIGRHSSKLAMKYDQKQFDTYLAIAKNYKVK